ncbi:MAG: hypothetical protein AAB625_02505 [Patescibacteria group bacterium]
MKRIDAYALARFLILVALLIGVIYTGSKIDTLSKRLERIEAKLGGPEKIGCNEKDSIEKVRQSVVRIVGGEGEGSGLSPYGAVDRI